MICNFTSFSTVFQSYQDDGRLVMKGFEQWNCAYGGLEGVLRIIQRIFLFLHENKPSRRDDSNDGSQHVF